MSQKDISRRKFIKNLGGGVVGADGESDGVGDGRLEDWKLEVGGWKTGSPSTTLRTGLRV